MMKSASVAVPAVVRLPQFPSIRALAALLALALRQQARGWRLVVLGLLFLLPGGLATMQYLTSSLWSLGDNPAGDLDFVFIFYLIPHALAPLAALLCAGGIIRDEVEEQTLTYVLLRPLPRTAIYIIKLLAALVASALLTCFFTVATFFYIALITKVPIDAELFRQAAKIAAIFSLAQVAYCGLFSLMALFMRRSLVVGVLYIAFFEGILAIFDTIARRMTVMYYFRVLALRWLDPAGSSEWKFDVNTAPNASACVWILLGAGLAMTLIGSLIFATREFRMKTSEGE